MPPRRREACIPSAVSVHTAVIGGRCLENVHTAPSHLSCLPSADFVSPHSPRFWIVSCPAAPSYVRPHITRYGADCRFHHATKPVLGRRHIRERIRASAKVAKRREMANVIGWLMYLFTFMHGLATRNCLPNGRAFTRLKRPIKTVRNGQHTLAASPWRRPYERADNVIVPRWQ